MSTEAPNLLKRMILHVGLLSSSSNSGDSDGDGDGDGDNETT